MVNLLISKGSCWTDWPPGWAALSWHSLLMNSAVVLFMPAMYSPAACGFISLGFNVRLLVFQYSPCLKPTKWDRWAAWLAAWLDGQYANKSRPPPIHSHEMLTNPRDKGGSGTTWYTQVNYASDRTLWQNGTGEQSGWSFQWMKL